MTPIQVLLLGSGQDAIEARTWDVSGWAVCAIHNAWSILPKKTLFFIKSADFRPPPQNRPPVSFLSEVETISFREYDSPQQRQRFGGQGVGIGSTMFFNAAYWILAELQPHVLGFVGCSMSYPQGKSNTFYGSGQADPLRFSSNQLLTWFEKFQEHASRAGCLLINFGSGGLMPYPRRPFNM